MLTDEFIESMIDIATLEIQYEIGVVKAEMYEVYFSKDYQDAWETEDRDDHGRWTDGGGSSDSTSGGVSSATMGGQKPDVGTVLDHPDYGQVTVTDRDTRGQVTVQTSSGQSIDVPFKGSTAPVTYFSGGGDMASAPNDIAGSTTDETGADQGSPSDSTPDPPQSANEADKLAAESISQPSWNDLSADQRVSLTEYKGDVDQSETDLGEDTAVNDMLRGNGGLDGDEAAEAQHVTDSIDAVMSQSTTTQDLTAFRGLSATPDELGISEGSTFTDNGYVSTSLQEQVGIGFTEGSGTLMQISVPAGSNAIYFPQSSAYGFGEESEMLLPHGSSFVVDNIDSSGSVPVVHAHLI